MRTWRSARTQPEEVAWAKVLIDRAAARIVGAHLSNEVVLDAARPGEAALGDYLTVRSGLSPVDIGDSCSGTGLHSGHARLLGVAAGIVDLLAPLSTRRR